MGQFTRPADKLARSVKEYLDLRIDDIKLRSIKGLSMSLSGIMGFLLIMFFALAALIGLYIGSILLLGDLIGNYALASFALALFFIIIMIVLIWKRKKLFLNLFVKMFVEIFYEDSTDAATGVSADTTSDTSADVKTSTSDFSKE